MGEESERERSSELFEGHFRLLGKRYAEDEDVLEVGRAHSEVFYTRLEQSRE